MDNDTLVVELRFKRLTPRKALFQEEPDTERLGGLYLLQDEWVQLGSPKKIEVEVRAVG